MTRLRVLLIDDDNDDQDLYSMGREMEGFDVLALANPDDIEEALRTTPADVIVFHLNGAFGWQECEEVRRVASAPVVVLTARVYPDRRNVRRSQELNVAAHVVKPCTPQTLAGILRRVINGEREIIYIPVA